MSHKKDNEQNNKHFMDVITLDSESSSVLNGTSQESSATEFLSKGMLTQILSESSEVIGDFGDVLRDDTISITEKLNAIQKLEEVGLAETVKSFKESTLDMQRLMGSQQLLKIANTLKGTVKLKHSIQLQEDIDFKHPKVTKAFSFFLEMIIQVLEESGLGEDKIMNILEIIEVQSFQFEDVLQAVFKGVPISELSKVENPFTSNANQMEEIDYIDVYSEEEPLSKKEQFEIKMAGYISGLENNKALSKKQKIAKKIKYKKQLKKELGL